tara:strand:+ start:15952 stop:16200 length:249 start_codon:yes stop_codon:yes gene_type:complete
MISPIIYLKEADELMISECLKANFHTALDVKYAISDDIIWTVFIHPLSKLSKVQVVDALSQLFFSSSTFGDSYSNTNLTFPE